MAQNKTDERGRKQGPWKKTWESTGKTRYKGEFLNDKPVGKFLYWYESGEPMSVLVYGKDNVARSKTYSKEGVIQAKGNYINQNKDSIWVYYDEKGRVRSKESYANGKLDGDVVTYSYKGKLIEIVQYKDGKKHGKWTQFHDNGKVRTIGFFDKGYQEGEYEEYLPNGSREKRGHFRKSLRHGFWYFYEDGRESDKIYYRYGRELQGKSLETYLANIKKMKAEGKDVRAIEDENHRKYWEK